MRADHIDIKLHVQSMTHQQALDLKRAMDRAEELDKLIRQNQIKIRELLSEAYTLAYSITTSTEDKEIGETWKEIQNEISILLQKVPRGTWKFE